MSYLMNTYQKPDLTFVRGEGCYVYTDKEEAYLDFTSGIGVNSLGYNHNKIVQALQQGASLMHLSNLYDTSKDEILATKLCKRTGLTNVFFANSGAEANEGAIKIARKYSYDKYGEGRHEIITLKNSFHGRTITTLKATGQDKFHTHFMPFTEGFVYATPHQPIQITSKTCAIMIEVVQGEGGVLPLDIEFVQQIANICNQNDILLIVDEIQTGVGRCGSFIASDKYNIKPDIITLAKGLGGGIPIGAVLSGDKCKDTLQLADHGSTFGGNPLSCRVANIVVDEINDSFLTKVTENGEYFLNRLLEIDSPYIKQVRGMGLMIGLELQNVSNAEIRNKCMVEKVLVLTAGNNTIRFLPPLIVEKEQIDRCVEVLKIVLN
ncbi:MAG: acetylornithine aminotransferase [Epulopiscium sp. Nuni2H_MBin003]|nr:MAG: acetylornithine aminotransferase [Epulopiscium sp. Nuni2H_MBin003]